MMKSLTDRLSDLQLTANNRPDPTSTHQQLPELEITGRERFDLPKASFDLEMLRTICSISINDFDSLGQRVDTADGSFIYIYGGPNAKILAVAHRDSVCDAKHFQYDARNHIVYTPTLDDRLGCYIILHELGKILPPGSFDILLTEGEETGRSTAKYFLPPTEREGKYNWMFQFDRGGVDAVHYQYTDPDWLGALKGGEAGLQCDIEAGMLSDICYLEKLGICGVNVGTAYYKYHSINAYAQLREAELMIDRFAQFFMEYKDTKFEHDADNYGKSGKKYKYQSQQHQSNSNNRGNYVHYVGGGSAHQQWAGQQQQQQSHELGQDDVIDVEIEEEEEFESSNLSEEDRLNFLNEELKAIRKLHENNGTVPMRPKGHQKWCNCPPCKNVTKFEQEVIAERHVLIYYSGCECTSCIYNWTNRTPVYEKWLENIRGRGVGGGDRTQARSGKESSNFPLSTASSNGSQGKRGSGRTARQIRKEKRNQLKQEQQRQQQLQLRGSGRSITRTGPWVCAMCKKPTNKLTISTQGKLCDECCTKWERA